MPNSPRKAGLLYAPGPDGLEFPIIDVSHPAFRVSVTEDELEAGATQYLKEEARRQMKPTLLRKFILPLMLKNSVLGRGLLAASGSYLSGLSTYILKLGPDNLGPGYDSKIEKAITASYPGLSIRLRLQDTAELMAEALAPLLRQDARRPLHFINIAGGPSMDSLNTLILLAKSKRHLLAHRGIRIHVLDLDSDGPAFAAKALEALLGPGGALAGLQVQVLHTPYNWAEPALLEAQLQRSQDAEAFVAASSEGGLFDYADDATVLKQLQVLHAGAPPDAVLMATLSRPDRAGAGMSMGSMAALVIRSLESFSSLASQAGWRIAQVRDRPMNFALGLKKD